MPFPNKDKVSGSSLVVVMRATILYCALCALLVLIVCGFNFVQNFVLILPLICLKMVH